MTTIREEVKSELGRHLQYIRADRPDEWHMDELTQMAEKLHAEKEALKAENETLKELSILKALSEVCSNATIDGEDWYRESDLFEYAGKFESTNNLAKP